MNFLGVVMGQGKIEMEEDKVAGVLNWPTPKTVKDVRKFLGLANYYRHFVKDFAKLVRPLNNLTVMNRLSSLSQYLFSFLFLFF